jgi:hypothetical protein
MQKISNFLFCIASLALVFGAMWLLFPYTAMTVQEAEASSTPMGAEMFDDVDLGDFGMVPVLDMMQHYIDSPPVDTGEAEQKVRFQGC